MLGKNIDIKKVTITGTLKTPQDWKDVGSNLAPSKTYVLRLIYNNV